MEPPYTLVTFGGLRLARSNGTVIGGPGAQLRVLAVLAILATAGARGIARERLAALLWPESTESRARHALAQILHSLRRALAPHDPVVGTGRGRVLHLDPAVVRADVHAFDEALAAGDDAGAIALWQGELLAGVHLTGAPSTFEEWLDGERAEVTSRYRAALDREVARCRARGELAAAAALLRRRQALDPLDVALTLSLMETLALAGDPVGALEVSERHAALRQADLGEAPEGAVSALAARISRAVTATAAAASRNRPTPMPTVLPPAFVATVKARTASLDAAAVAVPAPTPSTPREEAAPRRRLLPCILVVLVVVVLLAGAALVARRA